MFALTQRSGQTIASLDVHLLVATRKEERCSSLIDEALGGRNVRRIALTFHPIDRKARSITRKLLNVIFSKLPTHWEGFYLARLGQRLLKTFISTIWKNTLKSSFLAYFLEYKYIPEKMIINATRDKENLEINECLELVYICSFKLPDKNFFI